MRHIQLAAPERKELMAKSDEVEDKVFDVAKPGKTAPDSSSRPVIVGHRTILKDPTVTPLEDPEFPAAEKAPDTTRTAPEIKAPSETKTIVPIEQKPAKEKKKILDKKPDEDVEEPVIKPDDKPEESKASVVEESKESNSEAAPESEPTETKDDDEDDTSIASAQTQKEADKKEQEEEAKKQALEKTIENKTYFVPIGEVKRKRSTRRALILILVMLLLGVALADLLVDSGMVKTSVKAPIHIFKTTTN